MPSYKTILVAIKDLDARSMPAVRKAAQLAKLQGATLELFHALSDTVLVDALEARRISLKDFEAERLAVVQNASRHSPSASANTISKSPARPSGTTRLPKPSCVGRCVSRQISSSPSATPLAMWPAGCWPIPTGNYCATLPAPCCS